MENKEIVTICGNTVVRMMEDRISLCADQVNMESSNEKENMKALDKEIENCVKELKSAIYGNEARTYISKYEELMFKKSKMISYIVAESRKRSRRAKYLSIVALIISMAAFLIRILSVL